jgi:AraC-like DNA-binding protein
LRTDGSLPQLRQYVVLLLRGLCRVEAVALHLGVDRRTVHRQKATQGTRFSDILESVRKELAVRYVERTDQALLEVAGLLGFASPSAFSRWYRASFGSSAASRRALAIRS